MDFTPIMTQADFDAAISDRLKRERETIAKRYADYGDLKAQNESYEKQVSDFAKQLKEAADKQAGHEQTVAELNAKIKGYETASVKTRIALELGLPHGLADRLTGEDEDAIRKDAEGLLKLVGSKKPAPPLRSGEKAGGESESRASLRNMLQNLKGAT